MNNPISLAPAKADDMALSFGQQSVDQTLKKTFALVSPEV